MIAPASRKIGKYEILHKLGRGGMADVYLAQDTVLGHNVALKLIEHADDPDTLDSIIAERRGSALQRHLAEIDPHVVRIFETGDADGFFYAAMEYIDGQDLSDLLRNGPLAPEFATSVAIAVAQTLEKAHNLEAAIDGKDFRGIVHGDIKPKNIRIDSRGEVRVLDFGIAKALSLSRRLTRNEFGSVPYGSPERLELGEVNVLSDLWSLAVMLYEMLTGLRPYHAESTERLERMIRSRIPPPPAPDPCPEPLRRILVKAMAPEPDMRYQTAREVEEDLEAYLRGETPQAELEDMDATRRTFRPDSDETRRTTPQLDDAAGDETRPTQAGAAAAADNDATRRSAVIHKENGHKENWPPKPAKKPRPLWVNRTVAGGLLVLALWLVWLAASSISLSRRGDQFAREISTEQLTDPTQIWTKWTELSQGNPSSWLLRSPRSAVKQKLVSAADHVISSYRNSDAVYESNWMGARDELAHALALEPDETVRGKLRITEGHLARINGTAHKSLDDYNLAIEDFTEAEKLLPASPDPELGMARVYVYGLKDIDKAYAALERAAQHGYQLGNREKLQLADGYRDRADRLFWDSRTVRGLPQEKDQVGRAKADYERALDLYKEISPFGNANTQVSRVESSLEQATSRLQQIDSSANSADPSPLVNLPKSVPPWLNSILQKIWQSRAAKQ